MVGLQSLYTGRAVLTAVQLQLQHEQLPLSLQARAFTFIQQFGFRPSPSPPCTQAIHIYTKISDLDLYIRLAIYANTRVYVSMWCVVVVRVPRRPMNVMHSAWAVGCGWRGFSVSVVVPYPSARAHAPSSRAERRDKDKTNKTQAAGAAQLERWMEVWSHNRQISPNWEVRASTVQSVFDPH